MAKKKVREKKVSAWKKEEEAYTETHRNTQRHALTCVNDGMTAGCGLRSGVKPPLLPELRSGGRTLDASLLLPYGRSRLSPLPPGGPSLTVAPTPTSNPAPACLRAFGGEGVLAAEMVGTGSLSAAAPPSALEALP
jgi:hypothetical protein